jgi:hypothetical protein
VRSQQGREEKGRNTMKEEVSSRTEGDITSRESEERARTLAAAAVPASSRAVEEALQWEHRKVLQERQKVLGVRSAPKDGYFSPSLPLRSPSSFPPHLLPSFLPSRSSSTTSAC